MRKFSKKRDFSSSPITNFPTAVAMCAVRSALRPWLRHPDARWVAVLETPEDIDALFYHHAASTLLETDVFYDEFGNDLVYVARLDQTSIVTALPKILAARRSVIIIRKPETLDGDLRLLADIEAVVARPKPAHFIAAARALALPGMTAEDAEYLAGLDLQKVRLAFRGGRPLRIAVNRLRRQTAAEAMSRESAPEKLLNAAISPRTLREMAGYGEAATWGLQVAQDLAAWQAGRLEWEDVDRGAVLYGKPGCGKTTYGRLLAATCGIPIVEASSARWQATGHLGDMLKAMRKTFEIARKKAPCILFIDEFDAFGDRSSTTSGDNLDYKRQVINALLECLDPPEGRPGVVVVAATNFPEVIDPALLRPGRLERLIGIPLPDANARVAILRQHLRDIEPPGELSAFVEASFGLSGAEIEFVARQVRRRKRAEARPLTSQDLLDALPPSRPLSEQELRRVAIHEAAHAVAVALLTRDDLHWVVVARRIRMSGSTGAAGHVEYTPRHIIAETEEGLSARIDVHLAGIAAERVILGEQSSSGGGSETSDLRVASELATMAENHFGFGDNLVLDLGPGKGSLETLRARLPQLRRAVDLRLKRSLARTEALVAEHRVQITRLAEMLIKHGTVEGDVVRRLLADQPDVSAASAIRSKRCIPRSSRKKVTS